MSEFVRSLPLDDDVVHGIEALAATLGHPCFVIDLAGCHDKAELLVRVAGTLEFPGWFGHNWDAFFDCLVDPTLRPGTRGLFVVLRRVADLRESAPEVLDTALSILVDAAKVRADRGFDLRVFVDGSPPAGARPGLKS